MVAATVVVCDITMPFWAAVRMPDDILVWSQLALAQHGQHRSSVMAAAMHVWCAAQGGDASGTLFGS
jgi:hypothetical protein